MKTIPYPITAATCYNYDSTYCVTAVKSTETEQSYIQYTKIFLHRIYNVICNEITKKAEQT